MKNIKCFLCNHRLYKRNEGLVCKNWQCKLYFKCGVGWCYISREKQRSYRFFKDKYDFDIDSFEGKKKWLNLKSNLLYNHNVCEVCGSDNSLEVHHILPRHTHPELSQDKENLMVVCKKCHKEFHKEDKYRFG